MAGCERIELEGHRLDLLGGLGAWLPDHKTLLIADTHFGKEATFRRNHIPVPTGSTNGTLDSIGRMLSETGAERLIILGDMFHARSSLSADVCEALETFFGEYQRVRMMLVLGNHDMGVGRLPSKWPIEVVSHHMIDRIRLSHHPPNAPPEDDLVICGHLHPAVRVEGRMDSTGKLPCFWYSKRCLVLPAIGEFTGTHRVRPRGSDRAWMVVDENVIEYRMKRVRHPTT
ncbi:MAG: ligase-associated DNA damage response endonuclease PdeM [Planctomycetota bacterium]